MKHQIKHRYTDAVLFECDVPDDVESGLRTRYALERANLAGAKWRDGVIINRAPLQISGLRWMVDILDTHMQIGCELHTLADWAAFDDRRIAEMDGRDALRFWKAHKTTLLALAESDGRK
jgi:hypothetical protein